jgi:hypothetical protein
MDAVACTYGERAAARVCITRLNLTIYLVTYKYAYFGNKI